MLKISILVLFCLYKHVALSVVTNLKTHEKVFYQLEDIDALFKEFIDEYDKKYDSAEYEHRYKVFVDNLIQINQLNREQSNGLFGIGPFTDLTFEEFKTKYTGFVGNFTNENAVKYEPTGTVPDSLDWRQKNIVTRVKDQLGCGSCYIFAATGNIESQYAKNTGKLVELSEQQILDCNSKGCGGGLPHEVFKSLASKGDGCIRESDYPYNGQQGQCHLNTSKEVVKVTGADIFMLSIVDEDLLKEYVASFGPLAIGIQLDKQMHHFKGGVFTPTSCNAGGHAVLLVGYGTDNGTPYWILKNSWGAKWCEQGYIRLIRGKGACKIGSYVVSARFD